jgi:diguanylate cyclase (GGDEF)-like protein/PAS domain S-box-containing protein
MYPRLTTKFVFYSLVVVIGCILLVALIYIDRDTIEKHISNSRQNVNKQLHQLHTRITTTLQKNIQIVRGLPGLIAVNPKLSQQQFELGVKHLFGEHTEIRNIAAAPDMVIRYMYPIKGNEAAIGLDYRKTPSQFIAADKVRTSGKLVLAGPLELKQGGIGLITRIPVFISNAKAENIFWGLISAVIDAELFYKNSGLYDKKLSIDIAIRGKDGLGSKGDVFFGDGKLFNNPQVEIFIELPYGSWQLVARPKNGWDALPENIWQQRLFLALIALLILITLATYIHSLFRLSIANQKFRNIIDSTPIPYALNNDQQITFVNTSFTETYGYTVSDISTLEEWWCLAYPDVKYREWVIASWQSNIEKANLSNSSFEPLEVNIMCKNGLLKTALVSPAILENTLNDEHIVVLYDITARKVAEKQNKLSTQVFKQAHEGIIITNAEGVIVDVNPAFCKLTGYEHDELIGQRGNLLHSGKQNSEVYAEMWKKLIEQGFWNGEIWNRKKNGDFFVVLLTISSIQDRDNNSVNYVGMYSDITQSKKQQKTLELMAHYDVLTNLPNRVLFADRFVQAVAHSKRNNSLLAVCFLDLDNFKPVNDNYGHKMGDYLLIEVAERIKSNLRDEDTVSRQGGDEFTLLLGDLKSPIQCKQMLERIHHSISQPYLIEGHSFNVSASTGITLYPDDDADLDTLIRHADQAMYQAKLKARNSLHFFNTQDDKVIIEKHIQLHKIQQALDNEEFCLYYQPKVNMRTGQVFGAEALIRWLSPENGLIPPMDFLPVIEGTDLEIKIGEWVINEALSQLTKWQTEGIEIEVSVNISSLHLQSLSFISKFDHALKKYPSIKNKYLQLEILESSALGDIETISRVIKTCRDELGVNTALDDFGTGYSSLTHLRNLPANTIKIDQSFVRDMLDDPDDYAIIDGVIALAESFKRAVIAEGVETTKHGSMLIEMGCDAAQGYGIAKPMPAVEIPKWLSSYIPNQQWLGNAKNIL